MKSNLTSFAVRLEGALLLSGRSLADFKWRMGRRMVVGQMDGTWAECDSEEVMKRMNELVGVKET